MKKLAILGLGHIGSYVFNKMSMLENVEVVGYDLSQGVDLSDVDTLQQIISNVDGVLACTPYFLNKTIAQICDENQTDYFDLTESVEVTDFVKTLKNANFVTQCGLAPGMVSIIANQLAKELQTVENIEIRVGAIPENVSNHMGYYLTWNTEGLINEYINPCPAVKDGVFAYLDPLTLQEDVTLNGARLEACTTSGGLGSLAESYVGKAKNVNYKTLRYPGHWDKMRFLKDDLGLAKNFDTYVKLFNENVPKATRDYVFILINVTGYNNNVYEIKQYSKIINSMGNETAIQRTTGYGVMAVLEYWLNGNLDSNKGWVKQEDLNFEKIWTTNSCQVYR